MEKEESLFNKIDIAINKYKKYIGSLPKEGKKPIKYHNKESMRSLEKEAYRYPIVKNKNVFDSLYIVYWEIKEYLEKNPQNNSEKLKKQMEEIKNMLLIPNMRYVKKIAIVYQNDYIELADLINEGLEGLIQSYEKYDPNKNAKFLTYAAFWIKRSIQMASDKAKLIKLPAATQRKIKKINDHKNELRSRLNREPTNKELADSIDLSPQKIIEMENYNKEVLSLESALSYGGDDVCLLKFLEDEKFLFEEGFSSRDLVERIFKGANLTDREKDILWKRANGKILEEIGKDYNLTRERIRQIEFKALKKVRIHYKHLQGLEKLGVSSE